ncbi:hypothetical protein CCH79_00002831, partial [Gambusia affinis]
MCRSNVCGVLGSAKAVFADRLCRVEVGRGWDFSSRYCRRESNSRGKLGRCCWCRVCGAVMEPRKKSDRHPQSLFLSCLAFALCVHLRTVSAGECPADGRTWVPFGDGCYHFVHGEEDKIKSYTFEAALSHCIGFGTSDNINYFTAYHQKNGIHSINVCDYDAIIVLFFVGLLTIHSAEENDFVMGYSPKVWKGGNVNIWLGMKYDIDDDTLKWSNNRSVTFTNWEYSPYPADIPQGDICVTLHSISGRWENVSCQDDVENGVVCETAQKSSATVSALVILSVVGVVGVSAVIWFLHQRHSFGSTMITAFEYHPPFRVLDSDQSCLVEAEETDT